MDSGASLHTVSENEITSGEKDTMRHPRETTVITTASGKSESTEETTVCVNDLDFFVTNDAVVRCTRSAISGFDMRL